jgi:hypothetical protein
MITSPSVEMGEAEATGLASGLAGEGLSEVVVVVDGAQLTESNSKPNIRAERLRGAFMSKFLS